MNNLIKVCVLIAFSLMSFVFFLFCFTAQTDFSFVVCITTEPISYRLFVWDVSRILKFRFTQWQLKCKFQFHSRTVLSYYKQMFLGVHSVIRTMTSWFTHIGYWKHKKTLRTVNSEKEIGLYKYFKFFSLAVKLFYPIIIVFKRLLVLSSWKHEEGFCCQRTECFQDSS